MSSVQRIEIIVNSTEINKLTKILDAVNVPGYTVFRHVTGKGEGGFVGEEAAMIDLDNAYILVFSPSEQTDKVLDKLRPFLKKMGGRCYISEAQMVV
jgi:nitrogen regulatory protein PII